MARRKINRYRPIGAPSAILADDVSRLWPLISARLFGRGYFANLHREYIERHVGRRITRNQRDQINARLRAIYDVQQRLQQPDAPQEGSIWTS